VSSKAISPHDKCLELSKKDREEIMISPALKKPKKQNCP